MLGLFDPDNEDHVYTDDEDPVPSVKEDKPKIEYLDSEEDELLRKVRKIRLDIVSSLTERDGKFVVPDKGTDKILLDQCLSAITDEQFKRAKGRKDVQVGETAADWADALARTLMSRQSKKRRAATPESRKLPDHIKPTDVKPGEMDEGCKPLTMADIGR